jgi:hypothetical protein
VNEPVSECENVYVKLNFNIISLLFFVTMNETLSTGNENTAVIKKTVNYKRVRSEYDLLQKNIMKLKTQNVLNELEILKLTGKSVIFENQEIIASNVVTLLKNRKIINIMILSKTQSGKTG